VGYDIDQATIAEVPQLFLDGLRKTYEYGAKLLTLPVVTDTEVNSLRNRVPEKGTENRHLVSVSFYTQTVRSSMSCTKTLNTCTHCAMNEDCTATRCLSVLCDELCWRLASD
jgi:hypothetical protein